MEEAQGLLDYAKEEAKANNVIPSWENISEHYEQRWLAEKEKFQNQLKGNFCSLVERFASGKQEIYQWQWLKLKMVLPRV